MDYNAPSSFELSNAIYLLILIIVLLMGFSNRQMPAQKIIKYIAIWTAIGLALLAFYSFRFEISDTKERISSDLFPSKAINKNNEQLIISISQDNHYYLTVKINNESVKFMIDTGASDVVIDKKLALKLGINIENLYYDKIFRTANGEVAGASTYFNEIDVAGVKFYNVSASITSSELTVPLLGMSFLKRLYKYEFYRDKLVLTL